MGYAQCLHYHKPTVNGFTSKIVIVIEHSHGGGIYNWPHCIRPGVWTRLGFGKPTREHYYGFGTLKEFCKEADYWDGVWSEFYYSPNGPGMLEAKEHFESLSES